MIRVAHVVAALVLAVTVASAVPAVAMPMAEPGEAPITVVKSTARSATGAEISDLGSEIKEVALSQVGVPYSYGGTTPAGFDCSGFTSWVYSHVGVTLPHSSSAQYSLGGTGDFTTVPNIEDLEVGDLVFQGDTGDIQHVGIYVGNNEFVSATSSEGIQVRSLLDSYWGPLWVGGVRLAR